LAVLVLVLLAASFRYRPVIVITLARSAGAVRSPYQTPKAL
jgi:hypothetical protein